MSKIVHGTFVSGKEGVFNIPSEVYHNHAKCPDVNRGLVVAMSAYCPAVVKAMIDGKRHKKATKAMQSGILVDLALLEPHNFKEGLSHWIVPEGLNLNTSEGRAWKKDHPDLPYIKATNDSATEASAEDIEGMIEAVMAHPIARRIVERSVKQESALCKDPATGLLRKCRPDTRLIDNNGRLTIADLKSTFLGGTTDHALSQTCSSKSYFVQAPFYQDIYKDLVGETPYFLFFVVERKPPYLVRVFQIEQQGMEAGRELTKRSLEAIAKCKETGIWKGWDTGIKTIKLQRWVLNLTEEKGE